MSRLYPGWGSGKGTFEGVYAAHSLACVGRDDMEGGDKIILPQSAFRDVSRMKLPFPLTFSINRTKKTRRSSSVKGKGKGKAPTPPVQQYCGVMEFSAPEDQVYLPYWMMRNLRVREGGRVELKSLLKGKIPKGKSCRLQPHRSEFLDLAATMDLRVLLEESFRPWMQSREKMPPCFVAHGVFVHPHALMYSSFRGRCTGNYSVLSTGTTICVMFAGTKYMLEVIETAPEPAVSLYGSLDLEVDFAPPLDSTPGRIRPTSDSCANESKDDQTPAVPESGSPPNNNDAAQASLLSKKQASSPRKRQQNANGQAAALSNGGRKKGAGRRRSSRDQPQRRKSRSAASPPTPPTEEERNTPPATPPNNDAMVTALAEAALAQAQQQAVPAVAATPAASAAEQAPVGHQWGAGQTLSGRVVAAPSSGASGAATSSDPAPRAPATSCAAGAMPRRTPGKWAARTGSGAFAGHGMSLSGGCTLGSDSKTNTLAAPAAGSLPDQGGRRLSGTADTAAATGPPKPDASEIRRRRMQFFEAQRATKKSIAEAEESGGPARGSALNAIRSSSKRG